MKYKALYYNSGDYVQRRYLRFPMMYGCTRSCW